MKQQQASPRRRYGVDAAAAKKQWRDAAADAATATSSADDDSTSATIVALLLGCPVAGLAPRDAAQLRLVCRAWRATADRAITRLAAFAPPPPPPPPPLVAPLPEAEAQSKSADVADASKKGDSAADVHGAPPAVVSTLALRAHAVSCTLPLVGGPSGAPRALPALPSSPAARRARWVRRLAAAMPRLAALELQCSLPGVDDLWRLPRLTALTALTLLDFPFSSCGSGGSSGSASGSGGSSLAHCTGLVALALASDSEVSGVADLCVLARLTRLTRLHWQPNAFDWRAPPDARPSATPHQRWRGGFAALAAMAALRDLAIVESLQPPLPARGGAAHRAGGGGDDDDDDKNLVLPPWLQSAADAATGDQQRRHRTSGISSSASASASGSGRLNARDPAAWLGAALAHAGGGGGGGGGLTSLRLSGVPAVPRGIAALRGLRELSLCEICALDAAHIGALTGLAELSALTLLAAPHAAVVPAPGEESAYLPLAPPDALPALRRALIGSAGARGAHHSPAGWAFGARLLGRHGGCGAPVAAYLSAREACSELRALPPPVAAAVLGAVSVEARGWQSASLLAHFAACEPALDAALAWARGALVAAGRAPEPGILKPIFTLFTNRPDGPLFLPSFPDAFVVTIEPSRDVLSLIDSLRLAHLFAGTRAAFDYDAWRRARFEPLPADERAPLPFARRLALAQQRSGALPARLPALLAALPSLRAVELAADPFWPPQVLGGVGRLAALPSLAVLRVDSCRGDAGGASAEFWQGLGSLTALQFLSLGCFEALRLPALRRMAGLRALLLRSPAAPLAAAPLAAALAPLPRLEYLCLDGAALDGGGGGVSGVSGPPRSLVAAAAAVAGIVFGPAAAASADFVADAADIAARGARARAWLVHALCASSSRHAAARALRALSCLTAALLLAALWQAHAVPEALATLLLAAAHFAALAAAAAVAAVWMLLLAPRWGAAPSPVLASPLLPPQVGWLNDYFWRPLDRLGAIAAAALDDPAAPDPSAAFTRLRLLSLRRCTLPELPFDAAAPGSAGSSASRSSSSGGAAAWSLWAAARAAVSEGAHYDDDAAGAGAGAGAGNEEGGGGADSRRRRAASAFGAALLRWLLPCACGASALAGAALHTMAAPLHWLGRCVGVVGDGGVTETAGRGSGASKQQTAAADEDEDGSGRASAAAAAAAAPLAALLCACPYLRFVDLTFAAGAAGRPAALAALAARLAAAGNVRYLAVASPERVRAAAAAAAEEAEEQAAAEAAAEAAAAAEARLRAAAQSGGRLGWLAAVLPGGAGGSRAAAPAAVAAPAGPAAADADAAPPRPQVMGALPPLHDGLLLLECAGFEEVVLRELGLQQ